MSSTALMGEEGTGEAAGLTTYSSRKETRLPWRQTRMFALEANLGSGGHTCYAAPTTATGSGQGAADEEKGGRAAGGSDRLSSSLGIPSLSLCPARLSGAVRGGRGRVPFKRATGTR